MGKEETWIGVALAHSPTQLLIHHDVESAPAMGAGGGNLHL